MSKAKKVTYKELMERNDFLLRRLLEVERATNYIHSLIISYIECNKHQEKLKKFLKEETNDKQTDGSNTKGNREDKSGDTDTKSKSSETGKKLKIRASKAKAK